jgi:hypothetical protein
MNKLLKSMGKNRIGQLIETQLTRDLAALDEGLKAPPSIRLPVSIAAFAPPGGASVAVSMPLTVTPFCVSWLNGGRV